MDGESYSDEHFEDFGDLQASQDFNRGNLAATVPVMAAEPVVEPLSPLSPSQQPPQPIKPALDVNMGPRHHNAPSNEVLSPMSGSGLDSTSGFSEDGRHSANTTSKHKQTIQRLKKANKKLRLQLKELHKTVEQQLEAASRRPHREPVSVDVLKDKHLATLHKKMDMYRKANEALRARLEKSANLKRLNELEDMLRRAEARVKAVENENKILLKEKRRYEKEFTVADSGKLRTEMKGMIDEIGLLKSKIRGYQEKDREEQRIFRKQQETMVNMKTENRKLRDMLKKQPASTVGQHQREIVSGRSEAQKQLKLVKEKADLEAKKQRRKMQRLLKENKAMEARLQQLREEMEEKDKEITTLRRSDTHSSLVSRTSHKTRKKRRSVKKKKKEVKAEKKEEAPVPVYVEPPSTSFPALGADPVFQPAPEPNSQPAEDELDMYESDFD